MAVTYKTGFFLELIKKKSDRERVRNAFAELRRLGYFARMNLKCCQSCALEEIPDKKAKKYVFYHNQDEQNAWADNNNLKDYIYLSWAGDGDAICDAFINNGINVEWNGSENRRIKIKTGHI